MPTFLLDTTIIIDALNQKKNRSPFLIALVEQGNTLACCPINITEVYAGMRPNEEQRTGALLRSFQLFPISFSVAELAGCQARVSLQRQNVERAPLPAIER